MKTLHDIRCEQKEKETDAKKRLFKAIVDEYRANDSFAEFRVNASTKYGYVPKWNDCFTLHYYASAQLKFIDRVLQAIGVVPGTLLLASFILSLFGLFSSTMPFMLSAASWCTMLFLLLVYLPVEIWIGVTCDKFKILEGKKKEVL